MKKARHTKVKKPRRYSKNWLAKQAEAEEAIAYAVNVSKEFWFLYRPLFKNQAKDFRDLVQDCVEEFYKVRHKYNPEYELSTFAYGVMRNRLRNELTTARVQKRSGKRTSLEAMKEKKKARRALEDKTAFVPGKGSKRRISRLRREEIMAFFRASKLSPLELRRIEKLFLDGKTPKEVALEENTNWKAISESKRRALRKIREMALTKEF